MTKMHRGKKAAASLMAGILLCQMFVFGVSKTSADAREVAKKMSFEVVGEGIVTVTDTAERTQEITSGSVIEALVITCNSKDKHIPTCCSNLLNRRK